LRRLKRTRIREGLDIFQEDWGMAAPGNLNGHVVDAQQSDPEDFVICNWKRTNLLRDFEQLAFDQFGFKLGKLL